MDKLSTDYINESHMNEKISPFNTIPKTNSKITKVKSQRTLKGPAATKLNANDIEEQLMTEIELAVKTVENFKDKIP